MGTNYYFRKPLTNYCEHCGRSDPPEELHIGKSSAGWCFSLHVYPDRDICSLADWEALWPSGTIVNEYGEALSSGEMLQVITRQGAAARKIDGRFHDTEWDSDWWAPRVFAGVTLPGYLSEADFHRFNHSERGPNGLLRHRVDGHHCIGHGPGTYDYIAGDFS
jgi:hypothetical protein